MNPNISLDQQPPDPEHIDTPPLTVVEFPNSDGIAFVKQEADAVEAVEPYTEEVLAEYEVECIMEKEIQRGKVYYLVKWKGFDLDHATWEPKSNLKNAPEILKEFEKNWRDAQQAAAEAALSSRTRKGANSAIPKVKREDSGNKAMIKKKEKVVVQQPEPSTNGLVVKIKKTTKDQNEEVFAFDEQSAEEAKVVEKPNESIKKKKVKELTKKVKLNPESEQRKKKGKNGQITVKSENIFDPRDLMSHQMFMSMQKNGMLDGSIMGYHTDLSTHNMLDSIKKENIEAPNPSAFMTINMTHFAHQAISAGTRENSSSNNNSQGFPSNENSYNTTDLADSRIGINIHSKSHEKDNNFAALAKGMERQRLVDYSDSSYSSSPEVSDSESVQDTDMEASTISPYGSLESGDIPIKVIGIRPLIEENDLEIMMAWKPRPNGEKPEDSRVKRFDLLKRGLIMPLIEYYEQNMQLGSAPSFNASILAKKIV